MRCQRKIKNGWGVKLCRFDAEEGSTLCTGCQRKAAQKQKNAVATALGKPGKNPGWRDPEYREWIRGLPCLIRDRGACGHVCNRVAVEAAHVKCKSHAPDRKNLVPLCPFHHDLQEGRTKDFERTYGISLKAEAGRLDAEYASGGAPV